MAENTVVATIEEDAPRGSDVDLLLNRFASALGKTDGTIPDMISTVDLSDEEGQDIALVAMTSAERLEDNLNKEFNLKHVVVERSEAMDQETGELQETARIILVKDDGTAFSTGSASVARSVSAIIGLRGAPATWATPSRVIVEEVKTRSNRKAFALRYLGRAKAAK